MGAKSGPGIVLSRQIVPNKEGRPFLLCGGALQIACTMKGEPFLLWVGRLGYIVYIGTESIAKTIVQAQRCMLFNFHSFWHTPLAGCGGRFAVGFFGAPWGQLRVAFALGMTAGQRASVGARPTLTECLCVVRCADQDNHVHEHDHELDSVT